MTQDEIDKAADVLANQAVAQGKLIELGWSGLRKLAIPSDAPQVQLDAMRNAFFAGAQHVFSVLMRITSSDETPENDARDAAIFESVDAELREFIADFQRRHPL